MRDAPNSPRYKKLRKALTKARESAGMTQQSLASALRRPPSFVSKYERGERRIDAIDLIDIARCLGTSASAVLLDIQGA